jgi:tripartite-type tricarboxylate transporter receptor subunit TctC
MSTTTAAFAESAMKGRKAMKIPRRRFLHLAAGAAALPVASRIARAQTYPSRPITIMVGAAPGGAIDTIARILTPHMRTSLRRAIIIENNGTAGGTIAHARTARAAPDGYTLSLGHNMSHGLNGAIYNLTYDVQKDFVPISLISSVPYLFVARSTLPANDLNAFVGWLKANAGKALQGIALFGEPAHVASVLLQRTMGVCWQLVPYRGGAPMMQDLWPSSARGLVKPLCRRPERDGGVPPSGGPIRSPAGADG